MKTLLAITTALSLGGVILLYVQQQELKEQLGAGSRAPTERGRDPHDDPALLSRLELLERRMLEQASTAPLPAPAPPAETKPGEGSTGLPTFPEESAESAEGATPQTFDPREMETFRHKVKRANELNAEEDQRRAVVEQLDRMIGRNTIGAMTSAQKERTAKTVVASRTKVWGSWQRVFQNPENRDLPMEQRRELVRSEGETIRAEAQKELETFLPAADAKKIVDEQLQQGARGFLGGGDVQRGWQAGTPRPAGG